MPATKDAPHCNSLLLDLLVGVDCAQNSICLHLRSFQQLQVIDWSRLFLLLILKQAFVFVGFLVWLFIPEIIETGRSQIKWHISLRTLWMLGIIVAWANSSRIFVSSECGFNFYLWSLFSTLRVHKALTKMVDAKLCGFAFSIETVDRTLVESQCVNLKILGRSWRSGFQELHFSERFNISGGQLALEVFTLQNSI